MPSLLSVLPILSAPVLAPSVVRVAAHLTPRLTIQAAPAAVLEVNGISPHQVLLERKIDDFSHKNAGDAITAVAARFPHSDVSADSDLDASR
jgi:hypothetical protein